VAAMPDSGDTDHSAHPSANLIQSRKIGGQWSMTEPRYRSQIRRTTSESGGSMWPCPRIRTWRMDTGGLKSSTITASSTPRLAARTRTDDSGLRNQNLRSSKRYQRLPRSGTSAGETEATCALRPVSPRNASTSNDASSTLFKVDHFDQHFSNAEHFNQRLTLKCRTRPVTLQGSACIWDPTQ
jgi:hypothetical protein